MFAVDRSLLDREFAEGVRVPKREQTTLARGCSNADYPALPG